MIDEHRNALPKGYRLAEFEIQYVGFDGELPKTTINYPRDWFGRSEFAKLSDVVCKLVEPQEKLEVEQSRLAEKEAAGFVKAMLKGGSQ